jgi:hypothetical protein
VPLCRVQSLWVSFSPYDSIGRHEIRPTRLTCETSDMATPRGLKASEPTSVWLKYCVAPSGLSMIVAEQSTEALPSHHWTRLATNFALLRDQLVVESLVIALRMIAGQVLLDHIRQGAFTQHDHLLQGFLLDGAHKALTVRIQIRSSRG